jgi:hypothetical protein
MATTPASGAQALKKNVQTAQKCAPSNKTGKCGFCDRDGYPILPVRYAVLPSYLAAAGTKPLSAVSTLETFAKQQLQVNKYTLRTLRKGFVHVYLGTPGMWQTYVVTDDGYLRLLADPDDPDWKTDRPLTEACKRAGDNIPASFITIPHGHDKVWIAFAEDVWSPAVRAEYQRNPGKRMQPCDVAALASHPDATKHSFEIGPDNTRLHDMVFEYVGQEQEYLSRRGYSGGNWNQSGIQAAKKNNVWQSLHGNFARAGQSAALTSYVKSIADKRKAMGKPGKVSAFALYDAVGIVKELNGHTHDRIEWRQAYNAAVARPLLVSQAIVGLKKQIEAATQAAITKDEGERKIPDKVSETYHFGDGITVPGSIQTVTTTRAERIADQQKTTWEKLKKSYNEAERGKFEQRYTKQMSDFASQISNCDHDWAAWARTDDWKAWLGDYDTEKLHENVKLMTMCAPCLAGGPQGEAGIKLWEDWLSNHKDAANPIGFTIPYAAIMGGRKDLLTALLPKISDKKSLSEKVQDSDLNKGDKLHDTLKAILASTEIDAPEKFKHLMDTKVQVAASHLVAAIEGAVSQLQTKAVDAVDAKIKRAVQAALRLYANVSPVCIQVKMTIGQYVDLLNQFSRKSVDAGKKFADVAGRKVRSALLGGMISIPNAQVRNTVIEVTIWTIEQADELKKDIQSAVSKAKREAIDLTGQAASALKIGAITLSREAVQILRPLERTASLLPGVAKSLGRSLLTKSLRLAGAGGEPLLAAGSWIFQAWALRDANKTLDSTIGPQGGMEAKLPVVSATLGFMGASAEVLGIGLRALGPVAVGKFFVKAGAGLGAVSLLVDGIQAAFSARRTFQQGDKGAGWAYTAGAAAFIGGAVIAFGSGFSTALTGAFLLGPLGWVLLLTAIGIAAIWCAGNLESTPVEIWLDRCYWGYGKKRKEGKWTDAQMAEEIADLNALVLGLGVEMGFNDDWSEVATGFDTLKVKLTLASYDARRSVYEWKVKGINTRGASELIMAGGQDPDVLPELRPMPDRIIDTSSRYRNRQGTTRRDQGSYVIEECIEVNTKIYKQAQIEVKYWPDKSDPEGWAEKLMKVTD